MEIVWNKLVTTKVVKEERDLEDLSKKELIDLVKDLNNKNKSSLWTIGKIWKPIQPNPLNPDDTLIRKQTNIQFTNECKHDYRNVITDFTPPLRQCRKCWHYTSKLSFNI